MPPKAKRRDSRAYVLVRDGEGESATWLIVDRSGPAVLGEGRQVRYDETTDQSAMEAMEAVAKGKAAASARLGSPREFRAVLRGRLHEYGL